MRSLFVKLRVLLIIVLATIPGAFVGCEGPASGSASNSGNATVKALPASAMRFHKPKELAAAVTRMRELHDVITSSEALPESIKYQVKEVIHGTGASGHSHYYLHDQHNADASKGDADHGHETSGEKIHDVSIDAFVELKDLSKWLPKIASMSNMAESDWSQVNEVSKQMTPMLNEIVKQSSDNEQRRASYGDQAVSISSLLITLEELSK